MKSSELRAQARQSLSGKWGKAAFITLIFIASLSLLTMLFENSSTISGIISLLSPALNFGFIASLIKLIESDDTYYIGFLTDGLKKFIHVWSIILRVILKLILPIIIGLVGLITIFYSTFNSNSGNANIGLILLVVGEIYFIVKGYLYSLVFFILYAEPTLTTGEIVKKSETLMRGNRWKLFCLNLSFIGWIILASIPFGIGLFWVLPYIQISGFKFYEMLNDTTVASDPDEDSSSPIVEK